MNPALAIRTATNALRVSSFNDDDVYVYDAATKELVRSISCKDSQVRDSHYIGLRVNAGESWAKGMTAKSLGLWTSAKCEACGGSGWIGGPSYYSPDEGGEPCQDCTPLDTLTPADRALAASIAAANPLETT